MLVVGHSWAALTWAANSVDDALAWAGHADKISAGNTTKDRGTTTADWNTLSYPSRLQQALVAYLTNDVISLHLGGNDFLGQWHVSMTLAAQDALS